jgi:uncharacterized 2Fe-2S/4Fe-4S cluster protein (DUF4445 family)
MKKNIRFAVDLGTTTVDCCLYSETEGKRLSTYSFKNPQSLYGSDVINRINATIKQPRNLQRLKELISNKLDEALDILMESASKSASCHIEKNDVYKVVICGNTTMVALLYGMEVENLGHYPFDTPFTVSILCKPKDINLNLPNPSAEVLLSGCASAFIGGDILAGLAYLKEEEGITGDKVGSFMLLDLGTNGEMVLGAGDKLYATSASCGPAFENCTRRQNAYGSSTIDALAMCLNSKRMDSFGRLEDKYLESGIDIMGLHIDMDIIHQILLAKAAIRTGIDCLLEKGKISPDKLDRVYLAGGFGFYLNIENAVNLGMLPGEFKNKIRIVGNSSMKGACRVSAADIDSFVGHIEVLQPAMEDDYQNRLIGNMKFGG